jgi:hypothetical protein
VEEAARSCRCGQKISESMDGHVNGFGHEQRRTNGGVGRENLLVKSARGTEEESVLPLCPVAHRLVNKK